MEQEWIDQQLHYLVKCQERGNDQEVRMVAKLIADRLQAKVRTLEDQLRERDAELGRWKDAFSEEGTRAEPEEFDEWVDRMSSSFHTWNRLDITRAAWLAARQSAIAFAARSTNTKGLPE